LLLLATSRSVLTAIFLGEPGLAGFTGAKELSEIRPSIEVVVTTDGQTDRCTELVKQYHAPHEYSADRQNKSVT